VGYDFDGVHVPENDDDNYSIAYAEFVVPLVKAVQELSASNDTKDAKIDAQQKKIDHLELMMLQMQQSIQTLQNCGPCSNSQTSVQNQSSVILGNDAASLQQNVPNPFNHTTSIAYSLPQKFASAQLIVADKAGKIIKQVQLKEAGIGMVNLDAATLSSGAYHYTLYVDGKMIDSKQMILAK
jgi:hypothetical protein